MNKKNSSSKKSGTSKSVKKVSTPPEELGASKQTLSSGVGKATRIDLDYIFGGNTHCFWASVNGKSYFKWLNDDQVKTIGHAAFNAPIVNIQYNTSTNEIERIRPIKNF
jgi:hypothetical protein